MNLRLSDMATKADGLCVCGCGGKTGIAIRNRKRLGHVKGIPYKFIHGHNRMKSGVEYRVDKSGCWLWLRGKDSDGYGGANLNGVRMSAHVKYYLIHKGDIPRGLEIDHLCRNHSCVNPGHLEAVTKKENIRRGKSTKLNIEGAREIRKLRESGRLVREIASLMGVSTFAVYEVVRGKRWQEDLSAPF